jgi:hypothetical protein
VLINLDDYGYIYSVVLEQGLSGRRSAKKGVDLSSRQGYVIKTRAAKLTF